MSYLVKYAARHTAVLGLWLLVLLGAVDKGIAHPVSFRGSKGIMGQHSPIFSHVQLNYSFRHWWALGYHHYEIPSDTDNLNANLLSANFLLKRWNGDALQANFYAILGAGQSELSGFSKTAGLGAFQFDIEDREYYFLARHSQLFTEDRDDFEQSIVRFGVAPYIERFEGLHSWIIIEGQRFRLPTGSYETDLTPFLRFFYRNMLFEIGQSFEGQTRINYIAHF